MAEAAVLDRIEAAYDSTPWWYDIRGFFILTFAYRSTLGRQVRFFGRNMASKHLEVAVGTGTLFDLVLRWRSWKRMPAVETTAFDYAEPMLAGARKRFRDDSNVKLERADAANLPYASDTFESANIANAVHCFPDVDETLREIGRVLKPGGRLAMNVLLHPGGPAPLRAIAARINAWGKRKGILHCSYERRDIERRVREAGFDILESEEAGNTLMLSARKPLPPAPSLDARPVDGVFSYLEAFERNLGWVTQDEQRQLRGKRIAIAGLGGTGGVHLRTLARLGVGAFHLADFDIYKLVNFNRQAGATLDTIGLPKVEVQARTALQINPELDLRLFRSGISKNNIDEFLLGADLYLDALDYFAFETRALVFRRCAELGIPALTAAPMGMSAACVWFLPGGMSFEDYIGWEGKSAAEKALRLLVGLSPAMSQRTYLADPAQVRMAEGAGPSTAMACQLCAGVAATEALKLLLRRGEIRSAPHAFQFDAYRNKLLKTWRPGGHRNPLQAWTRFLVRRKLGIPRNA